MPTPYQIKSGDTLSQIAQTNKTDVNALLKLNPSIKNPNLIIAGQSLNLPDTPAPVTEQFKAPTGVVTSDPLRNAEQKTVYEQAKKDSEEEAELQRLQRRTAIEDLKSVLTPTGTAPKAPNSVEDFTRLRTEQGIPGLEAQLREVRQAKLGLLTNFRKYSSQVSTGVVESIAERKISKEGQATQDQIDQITSLETEIADQLETSSRMIETIMDLSQTDYQNASEEYNRQFQQNLSILSAVRGIEQDQVSAQERKQDNARANLQILANQLASGDLTLDDNPQLKAELSKLELQAGMPLGTIASIRDTNPKADIVSTTTRTDAAGNKYLDIVTRDKSTGALKVESTTLGKERVPSSGGTSSGGTSSTGAKSDGYKFTQSQLQTASSKANIPLHDLKQLPGQVINVFTSGRYDQLKKQVEQDLEDFISPSEIEGEISNDSTLPDPVKDALVRYLKSIAKRYQ